MSRKTFRETHLHSGSVFVRNEMKTFLAHIPILGVGTLGVTKLALPIKISGFAMYVHFKEPRRKEKFSSVDVSNFHVFVVRMSKC